MQTLLPVGNLNGTACISLFCAGAMLLLLLLASKSFAVGLMPNMIGCQSNHADSCCSDKHLGCLEQKPLKRAPFAYVHLSKQSPTISCNTQLMPVAVLCLLAGDAFLTVTMAMTVTVTVRMRMTLTLTMTVATAMAATSAMTSTQHVTQHRCKLRTFMNSAQDSPDY